MAANPFDGGKKDMFASQLFIPGVTSQASKEEVMKRLQDEEDAYYAQPFDTSKLNKEVFDPAKYDDTLLFYDNLEGKENESAVMALQVSFLLYFVKSLTSC